MDLEKQPLRAATQGTMDRNANIHSLHHGNAMYSIVCQLKAFPVFIPKHSAYFPSATGGTRPSMILNPFKSGGTSDNKGFQLKTLSLTDISPENLAYSRIKNKREAPNDPDSSPQSKKSQPQVVDHSWNSSSPSSLDFPAQNASTSSSSLNSLRLSYAPEKGDSLLPTNEMRSAEPFHEKMIGTSSKNSIPSSKDPSTGLPPKEEKDCQGGIEDYTQYACHQPIPISAIKDYSGFLPQETPSQHEKQETQTNLGEKQSIGGQLSINLTFKDEREEGEISSGDSISDEFDFKYGSLPLDPSHLPTEEKGDLQHATGDRKAGDAQTALSHSKGHAASSSDDKKWPNDLFEAQFDHDLSHSSEKQPKPSSSRDNQDPRYEDHPNHDSESNPSDKNNGYYSNGYYHYHQQHYPSDEKMDEEEDANDSESGEYKEEEEDHDYDEYGFAYVSDDDYYSEYRHQHRHRHGHNHSYDRDQQSRRHDSRSASSKDWHSKKSKEGEKEEESTSQSDFEEHYPILNKLRRVSHQWRKKERWLSSLPSEEGEVPIENVKKSFFLKEGIDLASRTKTNHLTIGLAPNEKQFLESLEKRHREKWNARHGLTDSSNYVNLLKEEILQALQDSTPRTPEKSEDDQDPWAIAKVQKQRFKQFRQQRRRVFIPFQPSPDVIDHGYYSPDVYLRYTFILTIPGSQTSAVPSATMTPAAPKRPEDSLHRVNSKPPLVGDGSIVVKGYKSWKKQSQSTRETREQALPSLLRKRV